MSHRTLILGVEAALPTTTGTATSVTEASVVRLINTDSSSAHLVTVVETPSGSTVGSFTMPAGSVEFLEKQYTQCIFAADNAVKGAKVGFTN
tara:strand:+ start:834 stop:1109 length:276 start_codon:yes stop_codon:yes gene_type:complete